MKIFKVLSEKQRSRTQHNKELDINSAFYVKEKDNKLWILHDGYAIQELQPTQTVKEIIDLLNNYKATAIRY